MLGMRDLIFHMLYLTKEKGIKESEITRGRFIKVIFVAFAQCYKYDVIVNYDILFEKSNYGATTRDMDRLIGDDYGNDLSFNKAKENHTISNNKELSTILSNLIEVEHKDPFSIGRLIVNSDIFKSFNYREESSKLRLSHSIWLLPMSSENVWTLPEILVFAEVDPEDAVNKYDCRLPFKESKYKAIEKYLILCKLSTFRMDEEVAFTLSDINQLRMVSPSTLESVEIHGARMIKNDN